MSLTLNTGTRSSAPAQKDATEDAKLTEFNALVATGLSGAEAQGTVWPDADADAVLEALAEEALEADAAFKEAKTKAESTKAAFKKALEDAGKLDGDTKAVGVVRTIIKRTRRFDPALAKQLLTPEEVAQYSDISGALVKANVAPAAYELMQADTGFSLELKVDTGK